MIRFEIRLSVLRVNVMRLLVDLASQLSHYRPGLNSEPDDLLSNLLYDRRLPYLKGKNQTYLPGEFYLHIQWPHLWASSADLMNTRVRSFCQVIFLMCR